MTPAIAPHRFEIKPVTINPLSLKLTVLFMLALIFRLLFNAWRGLTPDEAYYWVWSRHLAMSYLDHPPMVAYLIWASTKVMGSTEFAVRVPGAFLSAGTAAMASVLVYRLTRSESVLWLVGLLLVSSPMITLTGTLMTPDTPLLFFTTAGLLVVVELFDTPDLTRRQRTAQWSLFGLCCGLSMLSKYTGVLLPAAVVGAMLSTRSTWHEFRRPDLYLAGAIAALLFSPVILWNLQHEWVSIHFQLGHGFVEDSAPGVVGFLGFVGSLLLTYTPVLAILAVIATIGFWRTYQRQPITLRLVLFAATLPLVLFAYSSFRKKVEGNWPAIAFVPVVTLVAVWAAEQWPERQRGLQRALIVSAIMAAFVHAPELALVAHLRIPVANDLFGWRQLAGRIDRVAKGDPVICSNYQNAAELSFYMKGQPDIWSINYDRRPNAYDYFDGRPNLKTLPTAVFVGGERRMMAEDFSNFTTKSVSCTHLGHLIRQRDLTRATKSPVSSPK